MRTPRHASICISATPRSKGATPLRAAWRSLRTWWTPTPSRARTSTISEDSRPGGGALFAADFLEWLRDFKLTVDIDAVPEGQVVFPNGSLVRVKYLIMQCQLLEAALLNCVNFQTLIATKAARVCLAAQDAPVAEFGLRRAQGAGGGLWASRASIVGGCASTSNVLAGKMFDLPVSGTHAHSWVMAFPSELEAFRAYAEAFPKNCTLLVDTYNVEQGIDNAITVGLEMRERGEKLSGIRIDSGDLAWLAKMARRKLDAAGLTDCGIVLSNDLDEYTIQSILEEGAQVSAWGVGTKLACAYDQPTLGGVYKLSATRKPGGEWVDHLKISESAKSSRSPASSTCAATITRTAILRATWCLTLTSACRSARRSSTRLTRCAASVWAVSA